MERKVRSGFALITAGCLLVSGTAYAATASSPVVIVPKTSKAVNRPSPPCGAAESFEASAKQVSEAFAKKQEKTYSSALLKGEAPDDTQAGKGSVNDPVSEGILFIAAMGAAIVKHNDRQATANCATMCVGVPKGAILKSESFKTGEEKGELVGAGGHEREGKREGSLGYHGWERIPAWTTTIGSIDVYCNRAMNWSHEKARKFQFSYEYDMPMKRK